MDLSKYGGAYNGALIDSAVQEYDLKTGKLLYSWDALDHIPLSDSYATLPTNGFPWDAYHVNSIAAHRRRHVPRSRCATPGPPTWSTSPAGKIEWTLGGKHSSFKFGPKRRLRSGSTTSRCSPDSTRHDVRRPLLPDHRRRHLCRRRPAPSRGLVLKLDQQAHTATLVSRVLARRRTSTPTTWATPSRCPTATRSSAGARSRTSPSSTGPGKLIFDVRAARTRPQLPGDGRAVGRPAAVPARRRRPRKARQDDRLRELERRHRGRLLAGARPVRAPARPTVATAAKSGFETAIGVQAGGTAVHGAGARRKRPGARHLPAVSRVELQRLRLLEVQRRHDVLDLRVVLEAVHRQVLAVARLLVAAVRHLAGQQPVVVDPHAAEPQRR